MADIDKDALTIDKDTLKEVFKEAHKEWLDEKFAEFGKWTLKAVGTVLFAGVMALFLYLQTWGKK